jgi:hypothetical protein
VASGEQYTETITIVGLNATHQVFGAATNLSPQFNYLDSDGIMGMAFQNLSQLGASPFFQTLIFQGQTDSPVFALSLDADTPELTLGGIDGGLYLGNLTFVPVDPTLGYWQTSFDALNVNASQVVGSTPCIIDTVCSHYYSLTSPSWLFLQASNIITGDATSVATLYQDIPGAYKIVAGVYGFPCNSNLPNISFTFGGNDLPITQSLILGETDADSPNCVGSIVGSENLVDSFWILGDAFMTSYYTIFDIENLQLGFATLA